MSGATHSLHELQCSDGLAEHREEADAGDKAALTEQWELSLPGKHFLCDTVSAVLVTCACQGIGWR